MKDLKPMEPLTRQWSSTSVIDVHDTSKWFFRGDSKNVVLNRVDLHVDAGECVFLLGPSGSGKTTLLSIIGCVLTADEGNVTVLGRDLSRLDTEQIALLRRDHIGFVFQRFHLIRGLSAMENVAVPLLLRGWSESAANRVAKEKLELVGLGAFVKAAPSKMSVGQCQRVAFARALVGDPELILADEPTASLDAESGHQAMELLRTITVDTGKTVVVVTHDHRILPFADRIVRMESGRIVEDESSTGNAAAETMSDRQLCTLTHG